MVPPGQLSVYWPGCSVIVNEPERPATRFSFSPRMREPFSTSSSLTRPVPALVTLKVVRPASSLSVAGEQPASVSLTSTCFEWPAVSPPLEPQAASASTSRSSSVVVLAVRATRAPSCAGHSTYSVAGTR